MNRDTLSKIEEQKAKVIGDHPEVVLVSPCKLDEGILKFRHQEQVNLVNVFEKEKFSSCFFIPASGSGSRMFQFLFDFLEAPDEVNRSSVEKFLNHISEFAFFQQLPVETRNKLKEFDVDLEAFVSFLLKEDGMGYGDLPKGLIPFHKNEPFILNPFQEHILQGVRVKEENVSFHFTVQSRYESAIKKVISQIQGLTGQHYEVSFSDQDVNSDSFAFTNDGEPFTLENGQVLNRPAGHGALLENINKINCDYVFIKNIDNVQHFLKSDSSVTTWKLLGGILIDYKKEAKKLYDNPSIEGLKKLNERFQLFNEKMIENLNNEEIKEILNRPTRACGMVRNDGQPGGGPFWVDDNGIISKQIIEKSQITMKGKQYSLMVQSTYFNPVMIVVSTQDLNGNKFDLQNYKDDSKFFIVRKKYKGQDVQFIELPGLWNGSMSNWNSLFIEIPTETFSPVKTVLDLLNDDHK
jgi:hypothetical protein